MKAIAFDERAGCPCDCPMYKRVDYIGPDGDADNKCEYENFFSPGKNCPLPDVPEVPKKSDDETTSVALAKWDEYEVACIAFVEKLRGGK